MPMLIEFLFRLFPRSAVFLAAFASVALIPQSAWPADLRLPPKPAVQREAPPDWRERLFEEFRRYLQTRDR
jgi:hypothetical protein